MAAAQGQLQHKLSETEDGTKCAQSWLAEHCTSLYCCYCRLPPALLLLLLW
jgi:hypothetical protein